MVWMLHSNIRKHLSKIPDEMILPLYDDLNTPGYISKLASSF